MLCAANEAGWSNTQIAELFGVSSVTVERWRGGLYLPAKTIGDIRAAAALMRDMSVREEEPKPDRKPDRGDPAAKPLAKMLDEMIQHTLEAATTGQLIEELARRIGETGMVFQERPRK
jgi:hypothetical protein